jgi:hypothetical protein
VIHLAVLAFPWVMAQLRGKGTNNNGKQMRGWSGDRQQGGRG